MNNYDKNEVERLVEQETTDYTTEENSYEGMRLRLKPAWKTILDAKQTIDPKSLWFGLWHEKEVCCLFADTGAGKSIYSVQIADEIAKTEKVLYFDFELSEKQFQKRYTDENGNAHEFSANFIRVDMDPDMLARFGNLTDDGLIKEIEKAAATTGAKVLIVDNLTWICSNSESADDASFLMQELVRIKRTYDLSLLVIAHTPKRDPHSPLTKNSLAGSRKLMNFFDSAFAIGTHGSDDGMRYIKQIKVRLTEMKYGEDNVILAVIEKDGSMTKLKHVGYEREQEIIKTLSAKSTEEIEKKVIDYKVEKKCSIREIAKALGLSKSKVDRILRKYGE